jgi:hypothetical protein
MSAMSEVPWTLAFPDISGMPSPFPIFRALLYGGALAIVVAFLLHILMARRDD